MLIQLRPIIIYPIAEYLDYSPITIVRYIIEQLDLSFIDITYNFYTALYWINKYINTLPARNPRFKACYKYSNITLFLF